MRKIFTLIALVSLLSTPVRLHAEGLSTYVQQVLQRAQQGESSVGGGGGNKDTGTFIWSLYQYGNSTVFRTLNEKVTRTLEANMLPHMTACLDSDMTLLKNEMRKIREQMKEASGEGKTSTVIRLSEIYTFLNERMIILEWGSTHPGYADPSWALPRSFDESPDDIGKDPQCPFSTVYLDMSADGSYGCTPDEMEKAASQVGDNAELQEAISAEKEQLNKIVEKWGDGSTPEEKQTEGCMKEWPANLRAWSAGRFWMLPGERFLTIVRLLWNIEFLRPSAYSVTNYLTMTLSDHMFEPKLADEAKTFSALQMRQDSGVIAAIVESAQIEEAFAPLTQTVGDFASLSHDNHIAADTDKAKEEIKPIPPEDRTMRDFLREYIYFLRRSCMNRPCNASLDRIFKIAGTDSCFPYTDGSGDEGDPQTEKARNELTEKLTKKCIKDAKIDSF